MPYLNHCEKGRAIDKKRTRKRDGNSRATKKPHARSSQDKTEKERIHTKKKERPKKSVQISLDLNDEQNEKKKNVTIARKS